MSLAEVEAARAGGAVVVDTRDADTFGRGHLDGSINAGLDGRYAEYVGSVVRPDDDIVLVAEPGNETEAKTRLGRIGFDNVIGALTDVTAALTGQPTSAGVSSRLTAVELDERRSARRDLQLIDVREAGEVALGTIESSVNVPVGQLTSRMDELARDVPTVVFCAGGYRSSLAASLLRANGFGDVSDLLGGYSAWAENREAVVS